MVFGDPALDEWEADPLLPAPLLPSAGGAAAVGEAMAGRQEEAWESTVFLIWARGVIRVW